MSAMGHMSRGEIESAGVRVGADGNRQEVHLDVNQSQTVAKQMDLVAPADGRASGSVYLSEGWTVRQDSNDVSQIMEKLINSDSVTAGGVIEALKEMQSDGAGNGIRVTFSDDDYWFNDGSGKNVELTDELLEKILDGSISDAKITFDNNGRDYEITIKEGEIVDYRDGYEDEIPESVMEIAERVAHETGEAVTVVPITDGYDPEGSVVFDDRSGPYAEENPSKVGYIFVNDKGEIINIPDDGPSVGSPGHSSDPTMEPGSSSSSPGGSSDGPHIYNPRGEAGPINVDDYKPEEKPEFEYEPYVDWRKMPVETAEDLGEMLKLAAEDSLSIWVDDPEIIENFQREIDTIIEAGGSEEDTKEALKNAYEGLKETLSELPTRDDMMEGRPRGMWIDSVLEDVDKRIDNLDNPRAENEITFDAGDLEGHIYTDCWGTGNLNPDGVLLSYEEGQGTIPRLDETLSLQNAMLEYAKLKGIEIDLGNTGPNGDGADGQYGKIMTARVADIQGLFDMDVSGVADSNLMNRLNTEIEALKLAQDTLVASADNTASDEYTSDGQTSVVGFGSKV